MAIRIFTQLVSLLVISQTILAQNVGIGTTTPTGPLSFPSILGNKIVLWGDGNAAHYGFGIQSGLVQMYSDAPAANIGFGYGRSGAFTERMRLINAGGEGLILNGRVTLRNGTSPVDPAYGAGIWMLRADNSAALGFMGVQNNQNMGFYGGPAGWGFTYDAVNSRVGIGNNNPNAPLAFPPALGKKITLYPGATGDVGFAVAGNRLQIYSDNPNADVAIGYDAAGVFNERFSVKPNGALALSGNTGTAGQLLTSNGNGSSATWIDNPATTMYSQTEEIPNTNSISLVAPSQQSGVVPGLSKTLVLAKSSRVVVSYQVQVQGVSCAFCGTTNFDMIITLNGTNTGFQRHSVGNGEFKSITGKRIFTLASGTHTIAITGYHLTGPTLQLGVAQPTVYPSFLFIEVIPQN